MVVLGLTPMSIRFQLTPPSLLRNRTPTSLWKFAPAATQMVLGSPGTSRMSRQYVCPLGFSGSSLALAQCPPWSVLLNRPARPMAKTVPGRQRPTSTPCMSTVSSFTYWPWLMFSQCSPPSRLRMTPPTSMAP